MTPGVADLAAFAALDWEASAVRSTLGALGAGPMERSWRGLLGDGGSCLLVQTGMGFARAAAAARATSAGAFLLVGCAGGLDPALRAGDLVLASEIVLLDTAGVLAERAPLAVAPIADWAAAAGVDLRTGPVASSPVVLGSAQAKAAAALTGALAVEMEGAGVVEVARARGVPCAMLRVVLDHAGESLPMLGAVDEETGDLRPLRAAVELALRPSAWPVAVRLARRRRVVDARLRAVCAALLGGSGWRALAGTPSA